MIKFDTGERNVFMHILLYVFSNKGRKGWRSLHTSQVARQAGAYPGFLSMKRLRVFLLPPGWDASPSQGYPTAFNSPVPIYTPRLREAL